MSLPDSVFQLVVLLLLVVPGIVFASVRRWLTGPSPEDRDFSVRVIRAISFSVALDLSYALAVGPTIVHMATRDDHVSGDPHGFAADPRGSAILGLILLIGVPITLALISQTRLNRTDRHWVPVRIEKTRVGTPTAWDRAAPNRGACYIRIFTDDGRWVGGWLDHQAYVSTYPEPRDIFIDVEWRMDHDGAFIEPVTDSLGMYVPITGNARVAWVAKPAISDG